MKKEFRKKVINLRKEKDKDFIRHNSDIITDKLLQMDCIKNAKTIMLYLKNGIQYGAYNIREPKPEYSPVIDIKELDVVIVPAVAYDKDCYRLGYGGGFYDRFLENLREDAITIGIAFDLQIFDEIPKEAHDAQLDYIVTESTILTPK